MNSCTYDSNVYYADIITDINSRELNKTFQYRIPSNLKDSVVCGSTVLIPFGKSDRQLQGYVLSISQKPLIDKERIKDIISVITDDALVEPLLVRLAAFISRYYGSTMAAALRVVFPVRKKIAPKEKKYISLSAEYDICEEKRKLFIKKHQVARLRLLDELVENHEIPKEIITGKLGCSNTVIKSLVDMGLCIESTRRVYRTQKSQADEKAKRHELNIQQKNAAAGVLAAFDDEMYGVSLIKGITGSGKTEVYLSIVEGMQKRGRQSIVLIPEIALTYQTLMRFYSRFGDRVATLHSRLSDGERYDIFEQARAGKLDVVIGPRSALFTPFEKLGAIIIDEEHESSYKSEKTPKYHAREAAIERARISKAVVVLGSATPSVDSYYKAMNGQYALYTLDERATGASLADVSIVDMRAEMMNGNKTAVSMELKNEIADRLSKKEQIMLFINRRGYAGFISCRQCGKSIKCPHCDVSLSAHINGKLVCHYCGYEQIYKKECPSCGSRFVGAMKAGTEAIELTLSRLFPDAKILRMDADTTKGKDGHEKVLSAFKNHEADILIGTQMIVKGHDFPDVTLVGALAADMSLNVGDFRAAERTFQLLTQAAGRAGRGEKRGRFIIQTYLPENEHIIAAAKQDYDSFYQLELAYRKMLNYPPIANIAAILIESPREKELDLFAKKLADRLKENNRGELTVMGPSSAAISYINDIHRRVIYIKCSDIKKLIYYKDVTEKYYEGYISQKGILARNLALSIDMDPVQGY